MTPTTDAPPEPFAVRCGCGLLINFRGLYGTACPDCRQLYEPVGDDGQPAAPSACWWMKSAEAGPEGRPSDVPEAPVGTEPQPTPGANLPSPAADHADRLTSRRQRRRYTPRVVEWAPVAKDAAEQLGRIARSTDRLYLTGDRPSQPSAWATVELPDGWTHDDAGHYLEGDLPVWRFVRPSGDRVEVHRAAGWFGDGATEPERCRLAWQVLGELVGKDFDEGTVLATPATTGRYLWGRTIPRDFDGWPVLTEGEQTLIRSTSGQGRTELFAQAEPLPALVEYDGRWMYSALCWGLGAGAPTLDHVDEYAGQTRGRYEVVGEVPAGWAGPGIIGQHDPTGGWCWPAEPGQPFSAWVDGAELGVALKWGWRPTIKSRLLFPTYKSKGPLDAWQEKLVQMRTQVEHRVNVGALDQNVGALVAYAVRAILLHTIGAFHGRDHKVSRVGLTDEEVPEGAKNWRMEGDTHLWAETTGQRWAAMAHPEWSAAIYARARARLLDGPTGKAGVQSGMLHVPPGTLVGCRTDAVYLTEDPGWPDDGKVGRLRHKRTIAGPLEPPKNQTDLLKLKRKGADR